MSGGDRDDRGERPRRSWREIDRARDGTGYGRGDQRPRGAAAEARSAQATKQYLKEADRLFSRGAGGEVGERLAQAVREAHGGAGLAEACAFCIGLSALLAYRRSSSIISSSSEVAARRRFI